MQWQWQQTPEALYTAGFAAVVDKTTAAKKLCEWS
jgi:hypothetical protein